MLPTFHLAITFILWFLLFSTGKSAPFLFLVMFMSGVLIDLDILFVHPHRLSITHTPFFWLIISIVVFFVSPIHSFGILLASQTHIFLDLIDGEIKLFYPVSKKMYGLNIIVRRYNLDPYKDSPVKFAIRTLRTPEIIIPELLADFLAIYLFYLLDFKLLFVLLN